MSTKDKIVEIRRLIDNASESALLEALNVLKKDNETSKMKKRDEHFAKIIADNTELLKRLAD